MNKDIESLVGVTVIAIHIHIYRVYFDGFPLVDETHTIDEPGMVIDSITGDLFKMIGRTVGSIERRESVKVSGGKPASRLVTYSMHLEYVGLVVIQFKEPSND